MLVFAFIEALVVDNGIPRIYAWGVCQEGVADISKSAPISLTISIHTDHVDMEHILELIEKLSRSVRIHLSLMFNPAKREEVQLIYDILYEYRKTFSFFMNVVTLRDGDRLDPRYTKEDLIWQEKAIAHFKALVDGIYFTTLKIMAKEKLLKQKNEC